MTASKSALVNCYMFLFRILTISFLTTSISSGLLVATKSVILASASLLTTGIPSLSFNKPFLQGIIENMLQQFFYSHLQMHDFSSLSIAMLQPSLQYLDKNLGLQILSLFRPRTHQIQTLLLFGLSRIDNPLWLDRSFLDLYVLLNQVFHDRSHPKA